MRRRLAVLLAAPVLGLLAVVAVASPAAAVTAEEKLAVMGQFTQTSSGSYNAWNAARQNQPAWASYQFNWSTDYCSASPDQPLGFDFRLSCYRHDWSYRNYKAMNQFSANKPRLDDALYQDLKRKCATYNSIVRPACNSLAWTYYQAVREFGSLAAVQQADINKAADMKARAEARAEARATGAA